MIQLFLLMIVQLVIAVIVILVLKRLLDRELKKAALEKFQTLKINGEKTITIYYAGQLSAHVKEELLDVARNKYKESNLVFEQNQILKGGLVIVVDEQMLDFSVSNRLENFWL